MKAMILAAGLGTRLKPFTDHHPKALALVNGKPVLQRNIEYLQQAGIREVVVNVHHFAGQIIDAVHHHHGWGSKVHISDESDEVLETGGGLRKAAPFFAGEENIVLMNADVLTDLPLKDMIGQHLHRGAAATLATTQRQTSRYFLFDENNRLCGWRNTKTLEEKLPLPCPNPVPRAFSGIHVINQRIFAHLPFEGRFSMVDVYLHCCAAYPIFSFDHSQGKFIDIGTQEKLAAAATLFP
jgi:NDP-sugar pyrophosphorylase family protein